ncbi:MAG: DNA/RNA non-specific endonuclease [Acidobacteria bacterium]|jgi:endonuclease G|nr:DNA/RNA non-specific endonuclease [Acidobacteriota bacterium]
MKQILFTIIMLSMLAMPAWIFPVEKAAEKTVPPMEIYCKHFFYGYPLGTPATNDLIIRDIYALSNNDRTKFADWVAFRLTVNEVMRECDLSRTWRNDPWLDDNETLPVSPDAYKDSNKELKVDRGHQAPLASFGGTRTWHETNYLSNITPQKSELNEGPWMHMEEMVRDIVLTNKVVYVMTGPMYEKEMPRLPHVKEEHRIPSGYWQIIILEGKGKSFESAAFIFSQDTPRNEKVLPHLTTIRTIEARTGLNFLWLLEDELENKVETTENRAFAERYFKE